jgi:hypothetical protein
VLKAFRAVASSTKSRFNWPWSRLLFSHHLILERYSKNCAQCFTECLWTCSRSLKAGHVVEITWVQGSVSSISIFKSIADQKLSNVKNGDDSFWAWIMFIDSCGALKDMFCSQYAPWSVWFIGYDCRSRYIYILRRRPKRSIPQLESTHFTFWWLKRP